MRACQSRTHREIATILPRVVSAWAVQLAVMSFAALSLHPAAQAAAGAATGGDILGRPSPVGLRQRRGSPRAQISMEWSR